MLGYVVAVCAGAFALGVAIVAFGYIRVGAIVVASGIVTAVGAFFTRSGRVAGQWTEARWGLVLPDEQAVWWPVLWRSIAVMSAAGALMTPLTVVAVMGVWPVLLILTVVQLAAAVTAAGWAMSKVAAQQLEGMEPVIDEQALEPAPSARRS